MFAVPLQLSDPLPSKLSAPKRAVEADPIVMFVVPDTPGCTNVLPKLADPPLVTETVDERNVDEFAWNVDPAPVTVSGPPEYVNWPLSAKSPPLLICRLGDSPTVEKELP